MTKEERKRLRQLHKEQRAAKKAAKRIEKRERLEAKIPMKNGAEKPRPASKLQHAVWDAPGKTVRSAVHREVAQHEDDNVGVESAHKLEEAAEQTVDVFLLPFELMLIGEVR